MKKLYKFYWDCRRQGSVEGVFVAEEDEINKSIGGQVYFGEILGKHSEVYGTLDKGDLTVLSEDQDFINKYSEIVGTVGYNPLKYMGDKDAY